MIENPRTEPILAAALLVFCAGLSTLEITSDIAARRRENRPLFAWVTLHSNEAPPTVSSVYLLSYSWKFRTLNAVYLPPSIRPESVKALLVNVPGANMRPVRWETSPASPAATGDPFTLNLELRSAPEGEGTNAKVPPGGIKAWLLGWPHDLRYWMRLPRAVRILRKNLRPPLSIYDVLLLSLEAYRLGPKSIHVIWLGEMHMIPRLTEILLGNTPPEEAAAPVTVEIRNASGEPGVALRATKILRWEGFDVLAFGNARTAEAVSQFLDHTGDVETANQVAGRLGCGQAEILTRMEPDRRIMVTAVLGRDFRECKRLRDQYRGSQ